MSNKANIALIRSSKPLKESSKKVNSHARLKIIVRRLPPNLPEPIFWQSVQSWVSDETVSWKVFYPGKLRKKVGKENVPSTAYLLFTSEEYLATFSREYDGHIFRDKQGNESFAVVEFAPNPKVPPEKKKVDPRHATINQDEDYLSFLDSLQNAPEKHEVDIDSLLASTVTPEEPKITPLLAALREQKEQQKTAIQEKKILINEAKAAARKNAATAAIATTATSESSSAAAGKKGKKGKGKDPSAAAPPPAGSGKGRNRGNQAASIKEKEGTQSGSAEHPHPPSRKEKEKDKERVRPVVGLGSRHIKAALSGAGVQILHSATMTTSSTLPQPTATSTLAQSPAIAPPTSGPDHTPSVNSSRPPGAMEPLPPRGRGAGREKRGGHEAREGGGQDQRQGGGSGGGGRGGGSGGGGSGREKRHRPPSSNGPTGGARGSLDAPPPRILTRQDAPPYGAVSESSPRERPTGGHQESGNGRGRGRGGRRDRGPQ